MLPREKKWNYGYILFHFDTRRCKDLKIPLDSYKHVGYMMTNCESVTGSNLNMYFFPRRNN